MLNAEGWKVLWEQTQERELDGEERQGELGKGGS